MKELEDLLGNEWKLCVEEEALQNARSISFSDGVVYVDGVPAGKFILQLVAPLGGASELTISLRRSPAETFQGSVVTQIIGDEPLIEYASLIAPGR